MNIQRFIAPTSREALAKARLAFGDATLILSNRPTAAGVEVVATAEDALAALDAAAAQQVGNPDTKARAKAALSAAKPIAVKSNAGNGIPAADDAAHLAMSTLSFQDYVRERMLRRRAEERNNSAQGRQRPPLQTLAAMEPQFDAPLPKRSAVEILPPPEDAAPPPAPKAPAPPPVRKPVPALHGGEMPKGIVDELHAMKDLIEERFNMLTWLGQARQNPIQSNLMLKLIRAGYSPVLTRTILERMPEENDAAEAMRWVMDVLERNLKTDADRQAMHEEGGIFALVGATGVGKTTTAAKLAGICARTHGSSSVGLITLDTYRIGAHEQLRAYGRMLGVVAHLAHDRAALQDLLQLLSAKKMVLIDTTGLAPRDPRKRDMLDVLDLPNVNRLQVLNAGGHGDTLDDVVASFKSSGIQQAIVSKTDEAVKLGPVLDAAIRHQLVLRGITTGQRVPEDWEPADAGKLVRLSMRAPAKSAYDPKANDLGFFFTSPATAHVSTSRSRIDA
jgi:flagellar biosynthesis protein FlhF